MSKKLIFAAILFILILFAAGYAYFMPGKKSLQDDALFKWVSSEKDFTFYKNNDEVLPTTEDTERAHDNFQRTRFNKIVASVLDANGKLPEGASFPDSSVIIKEIYSQNSSSPELMAVMVKLRGAENSNKDWLWAEFTPEGEVEYSLSKKGKVCVSCHKPGDDYVRIFDAVR